MYSESAGRLCVWLGGRDAVRLACPQVNLRVPQHRPKEPLVCGNFVSIRGARWCFVVPIATDALRRVYGNISRNKALQNADFGILLPDRICKPLGGAADAFAAQGARFI
jgi:hypothetical protein